MMHFHSQSALSIPLQVADLRRCFTFGELNWDRRRLVWRGDISPDEFSRVYSITLSYRLGSSPEVFVRQPNLKDLAGGRDLPHVYNQETQQLCPFRPWNKVLDTAQTDRLNRHALGLPLVAVL